MSDAILARLTDIVRDQLDEDDITLTHGTLASDVEGWDSLAHVRIVVAAEEAFGLRFETAEIASLKNVGALVDLIAAHTGG
jgi:acyl carrier protein